jgi:FKBP-type peptidyl-prolyl cis-trans isomerases 1
MKTIKSIFVTAVVLLFLLTSCGGYKTTKPIEGTTQGQLDSASYALGTWMAITVKNTGIDENIDLNQVIKGFNDKLNDKSKFEEPIVFEILDSYTQTIIDAKTVETLKEGEAYLEANKTKDGVITLESGLQYKVLSEGNGVFPTSDDTVEINYKGSYIDGTEFGSSERNGGSATIPLNGVIPGWAEGIPYASEGGKIMLYIPTELTYGNNIPGIQPNATLVFEIELLRIIKAIEEPVQ